MSSRGSHLLIALVLLLLLSVTNTEAKQNILKADAVIKAKKGEVITPRAKTYLASKLASSTQPVKFWVFFTDKGISNKAEFEAAKSQVNLSEKVLKRRAKVDRDFVVFADIPVKKSYINQVERFGVIHKRTSRWLNAASFEVTQENIDQLDKISNLPFVSYITPVAGFKTNDITDPDPNPAKFDSPKSSEAVDALDYGWSFEQLDQINVPEAHNQGLTGEGVTLAIMDTGFRKTHDAFDQHYVDGRVLDEYDFVFDDGNTANEVGDVSDQWNHGTYIWSVSGGFLNGAIYGPAYKAKFLLAKTEDLRSETPVEEDNWIAALEWADSLGTDVITTSLGYSDWYTKSDYDGNTAPITLAANTCDGLGIVMCNSMGNAGPGDTTLSPPADAFNILAVGAVYSSGTIAGFSSRGPTSDGRVKPEVCAQGVSTYAALATSDGSYTYVNGTSLSTPLVAGAVCLMIEAHPDYTPEQIREALKQTADNASSPNNTYGWGIIDVEAALNWGASIAADQVKEFVPLNVNFTGSSSLSPTSWYWDFGDGSSSTLQNPTHEYTTPGVYTVSLDVETSYGTLTNVQNNLILALGDTLTFVTDSAFAGDTIVMSVNMTNSQPLERIVVPFIHSGVGDLTFLDAELGDRTSYFEDLTLRYVNPGGGMYTYRLLSDNGGGSPPLDPGSGEILKLYFKTDSSIIGGTTFPFDTISTPYFLEVTSIYDTYGPKEISGSLMTTFVLRGDFDYDFQLDIADLLSMVDYMFIPGSPEPSCLQVVDVNADLQGDISDLLYMVDYMFDSGPPPVSP